MWATSDYMQHLVQEAGYSDVVASGTQDAAWKAWQYMAQQYQKATNSAGARKVNFWMVISLPGDSYSETLGWHDDLPMLMPASGTGTFLGLARTKAELDKMILNDQENVHLTYKVKIQGRQSWRDLVEFLATHDMLEPEA